VTGRPLDFLTVEDLLEIASGVLDDVAVRDAGLLSSAAARPQTTVLGDDAYPTFAGKAAALMHAVARNHALVDGNKRLAWAATRVFCLLNGRDLGLDVDAAEALVVGAATGELDVDAIAARLAPAIRHAEEGRSKK
jgi:death-on-curing protein